jgi:hypothetical protein
MNTYVILRRDGWKTPEELEEAAKRSARVGDEEMRDEVRWIRSYVVRNGTGGLGTVCIYQGTTPEAIRDHARRVGMPADEVIAVSGTVVVRPDPDNA